MRLLRWSVATLFLAIGGDALAQSNPLDGLDPRGRAYADAVRYAERKAEWLARVDASPDNVDVLEGAADFFIIRDRPLAEQFLERARWLQPDNARWASKLAQVHRLNATANRDLGEARLALVELERAEKLKPAGLHGLTSDLPRAAFDAEDLPKARAYAEQLLKDSAAQPRAWDHGNAVHQANLVLGRIAVREGRMADAVRFLQASAETPGSPQLHSFGPNMSLAKDLIEAGEAPAVLAYFEACRRFWKLGEKQLDAWTADVKAGRVPNFGANLLY